MSAHRQRQLLWLQPTLPSWRWSTFRVTLVVRCSPPGLNKSSTSLNAIPGSTVYRLAITAAKYNLFIVSFSLFAPPRCLIYFLLPLSCARFSCPPVINALKWFWCFSHEFTYKVSYKSFYEKGRANDYNKIMQWLGIDYFLSPYLQNTKHLRITPIIV